MDRLVLKGGNALDVVYDVALRASADLDFSIEGEFDTTQWEKVRERVQASLHRTFAARGYEVFDVQFAEKPAATSPEMKGFWGGYQVDFKVVATSVFERLKGQPRNLRVGAMAWKPEEVPHRHQQT